MICKSLEAFLVSTQGADVWNDVRAEGGIERSAYETLEIYTDSEFQAVLTAASVVLGRAVPSIMEDLGMWICTHPPLQPVQRLFRFTAVTFMDLLVSLDELEARARLAVPELQLPMFQVTEYDMSKYTVQSAWSVPGAGALLTGVLRAMADEYGVLAIIEPGAMEQAADDVWHEEVSIDLIDIAFHSPKAFSLGNFS